MFWHASVLPSICLSTGGVPISHNALQHFPECHGADTGGYPAGGFPAGGTLIRYPPLWPGQDGGGGTQVGQQKEYSIHGGRYASCVHAGGLSCFIFIWSWVNVWRTWAQYYTRSTPGPHRKRQLCFTGSTGDIVCDGVNNLLTPAAGTAEHCQVHCRSTHAFPITYR